MTAPGETVLEVGCGSGAVARALVNRLDGANPVVAIDINPYILSEARALARRLAKDANGLKLPSP